ncbi:hypothetical protein M514_11880 [Trichuris suis]|uniref:Uncharacterized protein n=1 Tax=Trichuris suis TaxID=68888 RepID=A0A085N183_9BILA|nr:hypothetical protein M513_11880 [Trichuris suis]KFD63229.1 hypothetical protein M514_11880 [Trichuris suis]KHJ39961.1 hypothetical protein D918_10005 [Trichuris suis]
MSSLLSGIAKVLRKRKWRPTAGEEEPNEPKRPCKRLHFSNRQCGDQINSHSSPAHTPVTDTGHSRNEETTYKEMHVLCNNVNKGSCHPCSPGEVITDNSPDIHSHDKDNQLIAVRYEKGRFITRDGKTVSVIKGDTLYVDAANHQSNT